MDLKVLFLLFSTAFALDHWILAGRVRCAPGLTSPFPYMKMRIYAQEQIFSHRCGERTISGQDGAFRVECDHASVTYTYPKFTIFHGCGGYCHFHEESFDGFVHEHLDIVLSANPSERSDGSCSNWD
ncbi:unnamed protein product [Bursaphelenchus xylophilus]|uniref:(pine wood nematode) hypothetical protein n=1 Tax=Bursaphelenchus xylophilus TaxID=6326 RepID=A0A1I7RVS5_BURXY|nr:unnamed protein product [Bursaphelenchus xylophilus]CAG9082114.1 unnamed protein product [Bursaphelenchus xylophilus]